MAALKEFEMTHDIFGSVETFSEVNAPDWLTGANTVRGSTMDDRWFWELALALEVGKTIKTDFRTIKRIA